MISRWMQRLGKALEQSDKKLSIHDLERVCALLLLEIARTDHSIDQQEREAIRQALRQSSSLTEQELDELIDEALNDGDAAVSLHDHVGLINARLDKVQKIQLIEQMWRVALADGDIDKYEEYTIRKLADLMYVKHRDFIQAKLRVVEESN
ncbi:MAG: TerB family tellurite resistance protein [Methylococcales bacterium]|nr:TerB family tellurite resistance protein [Methylococcales bacterium]